MQYSVVNACMHGMWQIGLKYESEREDEKSQFFKFALIRDRNNLDQLSFAIFPWGEKNISVLDTISDKVCC